MKKYIVILSAFIALNGCVTTPSAPDWVAYSDATEAEYAPFLTEGNATISGQAFMTQRGGGVVKGAGETVTLDAATTSGDDFWSRLGFGNMSAAPSSPNFNKARRTTTTDGEGRFSFKNIHQGKYYIMAKVTWEAGKYGLIQGGLVGQSVVVKDGQTIDIVLTKFIRK